MGAHERPTDVKWSTWAPTIDPFIFMGTFGRPIQVHGSRRETDGRPRMTHGRPWSPWNWKSIGTLGRSMEVHGSPWETHGRPSAPMRTYGRSVPTGTRVRHMGAQRKPMDVHGNSCEIRGCILELTGARGRPIGIFGTQRDKRKSMGVHERQIVTRWVEIGVHGLVLAPIAHWRQRVYHGRTCVSWMPTVAHGQPMKVHVSHSFRGPPLGARGRP